MAIPTRPLVALLALASLPGCSSSDSGSAPGPVFCDKNETPLAVDDDELGFSAADVLARFGGVQVVMLEYYEGDTVELTLELTAAGEAQRVSTSVPAGADPEDLEGPCDEVYMRLPVELRFTTADGKFDERLPATWVLTELTEYESVILDVDLGDLQGTYTSEADELSFNITLGGDQPTGVVVGVIDVENDLGTEFNVARFNTSTWPQME